MSQGALEDLLNSIATDLSVVEFTRAVAEHPEWLPTRAPNPAAAPTPAGELDAILELSGLSADEQETARRESRDPDLGARIAAHDLQVAANLINVTYSTQQAAEFLDRDPSNIRRGVQEGRYHAVRVAGKLRLPRWQFIEESTSSYIPGDDAVPDVEMVALPNLPMIVSKIPNGLHPLVVAGFMETRQPELDDMSPIAWLTGGGEPDRVGDLLEGLMHP